jgi:hypothetical protein
MYAGMYSEFQINKNVSLKSDIKTKIQETKIVENYPVEVTYTLGIDYKISNYSIGFEHACTHTVDNKPILDSGFGNKNRIYIDLNY